MKPVVFDFLSGLALNNNREWFQQHKADFDTAKSEVERLVTSIIPVLAGFDEAIKYVEARDCMFRIFRDVRFSKDKSPYKLNMGAWITKAGRKSSGPGYYIHLQPGGSFLSTGVYMPEPDQLKRIRTEIYYNIDEFLKILSDKKLRKYVGGLEEMDKAKLPPKDFPKDFAHIDILKNRHFILTCPVDDHQVSGPDFTGFAGEVFRTTSPLNKFLRRALEE